MDHPLPSVLGSMRKVLWMLLEKGCCGGWLLDARAIIPHGCSSLGCERAETATSSRNTWRDISPMARIRKPCWLFEKRGKLSPPSCSLKQPMERRDERTVMTGVLGVRQHQLLVIAVSRISHESATGSKPHFTEPEKPASNTPRWRRSCISRPPRPCARRPANARSTTNRSSPCRPASP